MKAWSLKGLRSEHGQADQDAFVSPATALWRGGRELQSRPPGIQEQMRRSLMRVAPLVS